MEAGPVWSIKQKPFFFLGVGRDRINAGMVVTPFLRSEEAILRGVIETGNKIKWTRPKVDPALIIKIKAKYPEETGRLNDKETVAWALERVLALEEIIVEQRGC